MADNLQNFEERMERVSHHAGHLDKSLDHASLSVTSIIKSLIGADVFKHMFNIATQQFTVLQSTKAAAEGLSHGTADLTQHYRDSVAELNRMRVEEELMRNLRGEDARIALRNLEYAQTRVRVTEEQLRLDRVVKSVGFGTAIWYGAVLTAAGALYHAHKELNKSIIEANSDLQVRIRITRDVLNVQQMLGSSMSITQEAAKELVGYGYDLGSSFENSLKLVVQMHDGIGMSVAAAAELVAVYDHQLKSPVHDIADTMARLVNDTGLSADNAARMATNIGRALATLRPGISRDLAGVNDVLGRYEGALHELGGQVGQFGDMFAKLTTPEGRMQAGVLGVGNPEMLASKEGAKQIFDSFTRYAKSQLGNVGGWSRVMRLEAIGQMFGKTGQQVNEMLMAIDRANGQRKSSITIEERMHEQIIASADAFHRLGHTLWSLMQQAVLPIAVVAARAANTLASLIGYIAKIPHIVGVISTGMVATVLLMSVKAYQAARAFISLTAAIMASARAAQARALVESGGSMLGGPGGGIPGIMRGLISGALRLSAAADAGVQAARDYRAASAIQGSSFIARIRAFLPAMITGTAAAIGGVLIAAIGGYALGTAINKLLSWTIKMNEKVDSKFISSRKTDFTEDLNADLRKFAMQGDIAAVQNAVERARAHFTHIGMKAGDIERKLAAETAGLPGIVENIRYAKEEAFSTLPPSADEKRGMDAMAASQKGLQEIAQKQYDAAMKQTELEKQKIKKEEEKAAEEIRSGRLLQMRVNPRAYWNEVYGNAGYSY